MEGFISRTISGTVSLVHICICVILALLNLLTEKLRENSTGLFFFPFEKLYLLRTILLNCVSQTLILNILPKLPFPPIMSFPINCSTAQFLNKDSFKF